MSAAINDIINAPEIHLRALVKQLLMTGDYDNDEFRHKVVAQIKHSYSLVSSLEPAPPRSGNKRKADAVEDTNTQPDAKRRMVDDVEFCQRCKTAYFLSRALETTCYYHPGEFIGLSSYHSHAEMYRISERERR